MRWSVSIVTALCQCLCSNWPLVVSVTIAMAGYNYIDGSASRQLANNSDSFGTHRDRALCLSTNLTDNIMYFYRRRAGGFVKDRKSKTLNWCRLWGSQTWFTSHNRPENHIPNAAWLKVTPTSPPANQRRDGEQHHLPLVRWPFLLTALERKLSKDGWTVFKTSYNLRVMGNKEVF